VDSATWHLMGIVFMVVANRAFLGLPRLAERAMPYWLWQGINLACVLYLTGRSLSSVQALPGFREPLGQVVSLFLSFVLAYHMVMNWQMHDRLNQPGEAE
jgi:hypothetical protein